MHDIDNLDQFDKNILHLLQENGRLTNNDLAEQVHLSPSQCSRRRARLENSGYILGYHASVDRHKTGYPLTSMISVTLSSHNADSAAQLADLIRNLPNVLEAYSLTGEADYSMKVVTTDLKDLSDFINNQLLTHSSVQQVKSAIVLETIKESLSLPINP